MSVRRRRSKAAGDDRSMFPIEGIVADVDDPEGMHRIRVRIPAIDEDFVHDEWIPSLVPWVGPDGYGPVNLPEVGSEVFLFGRLGQKHTLYYLCRYNENHLMPGGFVGSNRRGLKTDGIYSLLADLTIEIISHTQVTVQAEQEIDIDGADVWIRGGGAPSLHARGSAVGFLGAEPVARQTLPGPAIDEASCIALANAMRFLLIAFGFAS